MGLGTAYAIGAGLNTLGGVFGGGGGQEYDPASAHLANQHQLDLWRKYYGDVTSGAGDFGTGALMRQANQGVGQALMNRGLSQDGGYADKMRTMAFSNAAGQANDARRSFGMALLGTPLQTIQTQGANFLPSSPTSGTNWQDSLSPFRRAVAQRGVVNRGAWG